MNDEEGLRGCWFEGKVAQVSSTHALVAYDELQDGETGTALQEWFPLPGQAAQPDLPADSALRVHSSASYLLRPAAPPEVRHASSAFSSAAAPAIHVHRVAGATSASNLVIKLWEVHWS